MSLHHYPRIVSNGLVLCLDAANPSSYPGTGTSWTDLSGNDNNATLVNGVGYDSINRSLVFDGSNDFISIPSSSSITTTTPTIIVGCTIAGGTVLVKGRYTNYFNYGMLSLSTTGLSARNNNCDTSSGSVFSPKTGYAIFTARYNGTGIDFYRDAIYGSTITGGCYSPSASNSLFLTIGCTQDSNGNGAEFYSGSISFIQIYNRSLTVQEIQQNHNALSYRTMPNGSLQSPFTSPAQAQSLGYGDGTYYFLSGTMASARLLEFKNNFYENKSWVCVFRSPYNSTATTNQLGFNIPMRGLLVQRDSLDIRGAVYWSSPILYNTINNPGNNTADSGYSPRRILLGFAGGHGIYTTNQGVCGWLNGLGSIGAGYNGSNCGSFPNGLLWGTGQANTAIYANASGIWSHWTYWE
jgi:hypothetical protein